MMPKSTNKCSIEGCLKKYDSFGYCGMHRQRIRRYGNPHHITSEEDRRKLSRINQPKLGKIRPDVYKKLLGKHEHRAVMEEKIGRKLLRNEIVHHIDGNRHNNNSNNLQILSQSDHIKLHLGETKKLKKC